jgi:hypothetical protein
MILSATTVPYIAFNDIDLFRIGAHAMVQAQGRDLDGEISVGIDIHWSLPHIDTGYFWQDLHLWFFDTSRDTDLEHMKAFSLTLLGFTATFERYHCWE